VTRAHHPRKLWPQQSSSAAYGGTSRSTTGLTLMTPRLLERAFEEQGLSLGLSSPQFAPVRLGPIGAATQQLRRVRTAANGRTELEIVLGQGVIEIDRWSRS
jgi:hypothetical protein